MKNTGAVSHSSRLFNITTWGVTGLIVLALAGFAFWKLAPQGAEAAPTLEPSVTSPGGSGSVQAAAPAIVRLVTLKTALDPNVSYKVITYTVKSGDSVFGIAKAHNIKPETLLWANYDTLQDSPDSIRTGQVLNIPPTDGVYYQWQEGDTLAAIAMKFEVSPDDILNWPGNNIDLANPQVTAGSSVMIPGGHREFVQWIIPTIARGASGTANVAAAACGGGSYGSGGFVWPTANDYLSGNDFWSGHLGIDIAGGVGAPVWAADSGVVTMAADGWNYGYGNVVMIDHGNGYVTLYGHLSQILVGPCQSVSAGQTIGLVGNTGNSFGAHLHFEVRLNGGFVNPWYVLP
jgi:murein DD-endopeptidase MepM/ murein hydrolase activator NlpD